VHGAGARQLAVSIAGNNRQNLTQDNHQIWYHSAERVPGDVYLANRTANRQLLASIEGNYRQNLAHDNRRIWVHSVPGIDAAYQ
jgi:hypothetical protein